MPPKAKDWYLSETAALVERDADLRAMQAAMDRMSHLEYSLPAPLEDLQWMRNYRTTAPYDALRGATRALARLEEQVQIEPVSVLKALPRGYDDSSPQARQKANEWERCLQWNMRQINKRSPVDLRADIIRSAVLYDEVVAQVVHLPTQMKAAGKLGGDTRRYQAAMRQGDFVINLRNPQTVHTRYSDYMTEAVVSITCRSPQEIVDIWGQAADALADLIEKDKAADEYLLCDYSDYEGRAVWVVEGADESAIGDADEKDMLWLVEPTELDYPFLPWVTVVGGTNLDFEQAHRRLPLLYPIYRSELWLNANITGSLMASEAVATMGTPEIVRTGPDPSSIQVDYGEPGGTFDATPGHDVKKLPRSGLDPALRELYDRHISEIDRATISKVLVTAEAGTGETFAGYNLRVQTAIGSLLPYKAVGERAINQAYEQMLLWCHYTGTALNGYGGERRASQRYSIDSEDIDPATIYLGVTLTPDVPLDRQQKIAGANLLLQMGVVNDRYILDELGVADPDKMIQERTTEQFLKAEIAGQIQLIQAQASGAIQQMAEQMAQGMLQEQAEAAQDPNAMGGYGQMANPLAPDATQGVPGAEGIGFAPSQGGVPPATLNPAGATREAQTGADRMGVPLA